MPKSQRMPCSPHNQDVPVQRYSGCRLPVRDTVMCCLLIDIIDVGMHRDRRQYINLLDLSTGFYASVKECMCQGMSMPMWYTLRCYIPVAKAKSSKQPTGLPPPARGITTSTKVHRVSGCMVHSSRLRLKRKERKNIGHHAPSGHRPQCLCAQGRT